MEPRRRKQVVGLAIVWVAIAMLIGAIVLFAHHQRIAGIVILLVAVIGIAPWGSLLFYRGAPARDRGTSDQAG